MSAKAEMAEGVSAIWGKKINDFNGIERVP